MKVRPFIHRMSGGSARKNGERFSWTILAERETLSKTQKAEVHLITCDPVTLTTHISSIFMQETFFPHLQHFTHFFTATNALLRLSRSCHSRHKTHKFLLYSSLSSTVLLASSGCYFYVFVSITPSTPIPASCRWSST